MSKLEEGIVWHVILSEYQKAKCLYHSEHDSLKNDIMKMEPVMKKILLVFTFVAVLVMPATGAVGEEPEANVSVMVNAPEFVSGTFEVTIDIEDVTNLDSGQFDLLYDPDVVSVVGDVEPGSIGGTEVPIDMWRLMEDGIARVIFNLPGADGVSGSGYVAKIIFEAKGAQGDTSTMDISEGLLVDIEALKIPADWFNDAVTIGTATQASSVTRSTPRPTSDASSDQSLDPTQKPTTASVAQGASIATDSAKISEKSEPDAPEILTTQNFIALYAFIGLFAFVYALTLLR